MGETLLIYLLLILSAIAFVSGIFFLGGLGWALIAFSVAALAFGVFLMRGLSNGE